MSAILKFVSLKAKMAPDISTSRSPARERENGKPTRAADENAQIWLQNHNAHKRDYRFDIKARALTGDRKAIVLRERNKAM